MYPNNTNYYDPPSDPNAGPSNLEDRDLQPGRNRSKTLTTIHSAVSQATLTNNNSTPPTPNPANDPAPSQPLATAPQRTTQRKVRTIPRMCTAFTVTLTLSQLLPSMTPRHRRWRVAPLSTTQC